MMPRWWQERAPREKIALMAGLCTLILLAAYLILEPVHREYRRMQEEMPKLHDDLIWMQSQLGEIRKLQGNGVTANSAGQSLSLPLVEEILRETGLKEKTSELRPAGSQGVRVSFDEVAYGDLMEFLSSLRQRSNARVSEADIGRLENRDGMVKAGLSLVPGG